MKKHFILTALCLFCSLYFLDAQNVFDPNDPINDYHPFDPPATPPANTLAKWVRTQRFQGVDRFKCYYFNGMPFRLRFPNGYNQNDPNKKYPVILFLHGGGEIAGIYDNEIQLLWGSEYFANFIDAGLFDAFLLFPSTSVYDWNPVFDNINAVLDLMAQNCHADPDRLITMGLSLGGDGCLRYTFNNPQRSALCISSSPVSYTEFNQLDPTPFIQIPFWIATGGQDNNAPPYVVQTFVDKIKSNGGDIRWSLFPNTGHDTWGEHWREPYLIPYWQAAHKANPLVYYKYFEINARVGISGGFAEYQWQVNNIDMPGSNTNEIVATKPGAYRVRFRRKAGGTWSDWSPNPAIITQGGGGPADNIPPSSPGNLRIVSGGTNYFDLDWDNSSDNVGIGGYDVFVNGIKRYSTGNTDIVADSLSPNTNYSFTIQAHDFAGNISSFSNAVQGTTANTSTSGGGGSGGGSGLNYKYYEGSFTSLPDFSTLSPVKTGISSNVDIGVRNAGVNDNFAFVWEGTLNITTPGTYSFETVSDDGSKFYFNSIYSAGATALVSNDGMHPAVSAYGTVNIPAAGSYPIAITFFERDGGESMQVYWSGPGFDRQLIPGSVLDTTLSSPIGSPIGNATAGLSYKYYEGAFSSLPNFSALTPVKTGSSANVDLSARTSGVNDNFAFVWEGYINIPAPGTYTFETVSDDGSKLYFNSFYSAGAEALVNNDGLHAPSSATGNVNIPTAGSYAIAIAFFEATGGETMQVFWSGPGIPRQLIPNAAFTSVGTPPPSVSYGLNYYYFEGAFNTLPNFHTLSTVKTGTSANTDIGVRTAGVNDNFAFVWEGYINIPNPGTYTFETISDDGSKLYFNSFYSPDATALVNNDGLHAAISATGTVNIPTAGSYPISISFFEKDGGETMQVYWSGPGIARELIPNSAFRLSNSFAGNTAVNLSRSEMQQASDVNVRIANGDILHAYPNPFAQSFNIYFNNTAAANKISVDMFDVSGRLLYNQDFGNVAPGKITLKVDATKSNLVRGVYFVRLRINGKPTKIMKLVRE